MLKVHDFVELILIEMMWLFDESWVLTQVLTVISFMCSPWEQNEYSMDWMKN